MVDMADTVIIINFLKNIYYEKLMKLLIPISFVLFFNYMNVASAKGEFEIWFEKGRAEQSLDNKIKYYTKAIDLNLMSFESYFNRGITYYKLHKYQQAINDFNQAIKYNCDDEGSYYYLGLAYRNLDKYSNAIENYTKAIKVNPTFIDAYIERGLVYMYGIGDYCKAKEDFTEVIKLDPQIAVAFYNRGIVYLERKNYEMAILDFSKSIKENSSEAKYYYARSFTYFQKCDNNKAIEDINKAIEVGPVNHEFYSLRGDIYYFGKGDYFNAIEEYKKAINFLSITKTNQIFEQNYSFMKNSNNENIEYFLISKINNLYIEAGNYDGALSYFRQISYRTKVSLSELKKMASCLILIEKGKYKNSIKNIKRFLKDKKSSNYIQTANYYLANAYFGMGELIQAEYYAEKTLELDTMVLNQDLHYKANLLLIRMCLSQNYFPVGKFKTSKIFNLHTILPRGNQIFCLQNY